MQNPVLYAVNKLDTPKHDDEAPEFFALGLDEVFPISVAHGRGIGDLLERLVAQLPTPPPAEAIADRAVTLALVGRPNVGKSSLLNRIVGYDRAIVDATPGTTRDPVDTPFQHGDQAYVLVDTAGVRRRPRVHEQIERISALRALRALDRAEVALLLIDATEGMTDQDARIAGYAWERGRALLLVINKWDAVPRERRNRTPLPNPHSGTVSHSRRRARGLHLGAQRTGDPDHLFRLGTAGGRTPHADAYGQTE